jgi:ABC-type transport system involved in multi-copper enzyme maturation permease subunit
MSRVGVVAWNTFREAVRDRVLYNLVFFALLMMGAAVLVGQISIGIEQMVIVSLGLSAISVIGLLMAVFIGVGLVSKEMDKRTLYALLAKPVRRWEFLLGKFAGLLLTLSVNTAAMAAGLFAALYYVKHSLERADGVALVAIYFILLKLALVVALALLFSCYTTPAVQRLLRWLSYLLPNFENFDVMASAAHGRHIPASLILHNTAYAALYCAIVLVAASAIFSRRNLK